MKHNLELLKKLTMAHGVSGNESDVLEVIKNELDEMGVAYTQLPLGDVVCGNTERPEVLMSAHADEVGFTVQAINEDGTVSIAPIGWVKPHMLNEAPLMVKTIKGEMVAGQGFARTSLLSAEVASFADVFVDVGVESAAAARKLGLAVGDVGTYQKTFSTTKTTVFSSALDNRISVYLLLCMLRARPQILKTVTVGFQTHEETNFEGLKGMVNIMQPKYVLSVDMFPVQHEWEKTDTPLHVGDGPAVLYNADGYVLHHSMRNLFESLKIPFVKMLAHMSASDLEPLCVQGNGYSMATNVFIPVRGYHRTVSTVRLSDVEKTMDLLNAVVNSFSKRSSKK